MSQIDSEYEVGRDDWLVLFSHWIANPSHLVKAYRIPEGIVVEARQKRIDRTNRSLHKLLSGIGLSETAACDIARLLGPSKRVVCRVRSITH